MSRRGRPRRALILSIALTVSGGARASTDASGQLRHTPAPVQATTPAQAVPRPPEPDFSLLAPIEAMRRTAPAREMLAALDKIAPEIAAAPPAVRSRALMLRGLSLRALADLPAAERAATEARTLGAGTPYPSLEFDALILLVNLASDRGDLTQAAARLEEAVPIADRTGDDLMRFNVRLDQGRIARARGRGAEAVRVLDEAVALAAKLGGVRVRVQALGARSSARLGLSRFDEALADAQLGYELASAAGTAADIRGAAASSLGQALSQIGDLEGGLELWTDAISAYTDANLLAGVSLAVRQRMDVRYALEDDEGALADGERALELFVRTGSAGQQPALLSRLSLISARLSRPEAAASYATRAVSAAAGAQPRVAAAVEADLASAALAQRQFSDARIRYTRVRDQARALGDKEVEWRALQGLGRAAAGLGDQVGAQTQFEAAIALIDQLRRALPEAGLRADFIADRLGPYDGLISALLARSTAAGDAFAARAFATAERARGRALAELMAETRARLTDPAVASIRQRETEFGARLSGLQQAVAAATSADREARLAALQTAEREYEAFVVRIRRDTPRYAALAHPAEATSAQVSSRLGAGDALASFWIGADRGVVWLLTRDRLLRRDLPGRRVLDRDVARLNAAIAGGRLADVRSLGRALYTTLLQGFDLTGVRHLMLVPDGPLWRAPFSAMTDDRGRFVVEHTAVSLVPSATWLTSLAPTTTAATRSAALVFGLEQVPPSVRALRSLYDDRLLPSRALPHAIGEARNVAQLTAADPRTSLFLNDRADESTFKLGVTTPSRVIHVASHALIDDRVPRRSALVLSPSATDDGLLQLNEIANLPLDVDLVVLSTCQSQTGRAVRGEGLISLSRAFLHGGARAVAASLWAIDDLETSRLMTFLYAGLRDGQSPAEALRRAQVQMLQAGGPSASPFSWAGFVVTGRAGLPVFAPAASPRR